MVEEAQHHRIQIENEPLLTDCGFTEFRLPLNGNATKMVLYNDKFKSMITYVDWDKHNTIDKAVKLLRDKLRDEQQVRDERTRTNQHKRDRRSTQQKQQLCKHWSR